MNTLITHYNGKLLAKCSLSSTGFWSSFFTSDVFTGRSHSR